MVISLCIFGEILDNDVPSSSCKIIYILFFQHVQQLLQFGRHFANSSGLNYTGPFIFSGGRGHVTCQNNNSLPPDDKRCERLTERQLGQVNVSIPPSHCYTLKEKGYRYPQPFILVSND